MLQSNFEVASVFPIVTEAYSQEITVLVLADWDHLPSGLTQSEQGFHMWLLRADHAERALSILQRCQTPPDVLIVDEDYFGFPEDAADFCAQIRRMHRELPIIAFESEMMEGESVLLSLGLCNKTLPPMADAGTITGALASFV